ncbi:hypothetical protein [Kitasatospora sp. NPDC085879]|uniref:hypothetical protein n=1 Tax=Kitasatospora sp. NPDC085879 TaxID=3154769 RepID=UPI003441B13E
MPALLSYTALSVGLTGAFGYFTSMVLAALGLHVSWILPTLCGLLRHRSVDVSTRALLSLMTAEVAIAAATYLGLSGHTGQVGTNIFWRLPTDFRQCHGSPSGDLPRAALDPLPRPRAALP